MGAIFMIPILPATGRKHKISDFHRLGDPQTLIDYSLAFSP
jgi:hypothetical protein